MNRPPLILFLSLCTSLSHAGIYPYQDVRINGKISREVMLSKCSHSPFAQRLLQALDTRGGRGGILTATDFILLVKSSPNQP